MARVLPASRGARFRKTSLFCFLVLSSACGGNSIKRHPVVEIAARSEARVELVELAVNDPERAARVRSLYLRVRQLGRDFEEERARAWVRATKAGASPDLSAVADEVEESAARHYQEYASLMVEIRSLVTAREFQTLNGIR